MSLSHYVSYAASATGVQPSINLDPSISPFTATVVVFLLSTGTFTLQYSVDPIDVSDANSRWFNDALLAPGSTASGTASYAFPITKVRLSIAANGSGIELKTLQGYTTN